MYNYTVIIPHKNCPDLLQRALDSVPEKDDIQVIIVDDNSDPGKVDFNNFPGLNRPNTIVVFDKSGKGAGRARNIGLSKIENNTKWVTFLDADDFFVENATEVFDEHKNSNAELIILHANSVYSDTLLPAERHLAREKKIELAKKDLDIAMCKFDGPVAKFISYDVIKQNSLSFEEIRVGNDAMFSLRVGICCNKIEISDRLLYVISVTENSLTKQKDIESLSIRYEGGKRMNSLLNEVGKMKYRVNMFFWAYNFLPCGFSVFLKYFFKAFTDTYPKYILRDLFNCFMGYLNNKNRTI